MYFNDGTILVPAEPQWKKYDECRMPPVVVADNKGPWAVRYLWCKHKTQNDEFVKNYFFANENTSEIGLNLRKRTAYMQSVWDSHNAIFDTSKDNGNLIWRVKIYNPLANSIDYIEVWRSPEVLTSLFQYIPQGESIEITDSVERTNIDQSTLRANLYKEGFEIRLWLDEITYWPTVSPQLAMFWYWTFVKRHFAQDNCRVNSKWRKNLNPWEGLYAEQSDINDLIKQLKYELSPELEKYNSSK